LRGGYGAGGDEGSSKAGELGLGDGDKGSGGLCGGPCGVGFDGAGESGGAGAGGD